MGKKSKSASDNDTTPPKRLKGDWKASTISDRYLAVLRADGRLPPAASGRVRCAGNEVTPSPRAGERVVFTGFLTRGLSFPLHDFVRGLLYAYGVQLHDLTLNGVLHIACFIVLYECFLGMHPHWGLWRRIFFVKKHTVALRSMATRGFGIQTRKDVPYFDIKLSESVQGWRKH